MVIKEITTLADKELADIIRFNFEQHHLNIPGTVYFDPELDTLSKFYQEKPQYKKYFVLWENDIVCGGIGFAEFNGFEKCAEIQKFYLTDRVKGRGYGKRLLLLAESEAKKWDISIYILKHIQILK